MDVPATIFRQYDIRGTTGDQLTPTLARAVGGAFATLARERLGRAPRIALGRDNRPSGPSLTDGVARGIVEAGGSVVEVGMLPTPALYFATHVLAVDGGLQVTGSHNPPEFNGFKMVLAHEAIYGDDIQRLYQLIAADKLDRTPGGTRATDDSVLAGYRAAIVQRNTPLPRA
ncbi:MAG: phosphomannomutase, partial [Gemmatimonadota bacterium]